MHAGTQTRSVGGHEAAFNASRRNMNTNQCYIMQENHHTVAQRTFALQFRTIQSRIFAEVGQYGNPSRRHCLPRQGPMRHGAAKKEDNIASIRCHVANCSLVVAPCDAIWHREAGTVRTRTDDETAIQLADIVQLPHHVDASLNEDPSVSHFIPGIRTW